MVAVGKIVRGGWRGQSPMSGRQVRLVQANRIIAARALGLALAITQLFDVVIHAATDQLEPLRVIANLAILLWLGALAIGKFQAQTLSMSLGAIGLYLALNLIFLAREGLTNPAQGDAVRVMLLLLVATTTALAMALVALLPRGRQP